MEERKQKEWTPYGEIEYETITCSSCDQQVPKQTAKRFVMGDVVEHTDWTVLGKEEYNFDRRTIRKGWACESCYERGPIEYPSKNTVLGKFLALFVLLFLLILFISPIVLIMGAF